MGDPRPPALNIALPIKDLRVVEYGDHLIADYTVPSLTTEGLALTRIRAVEVHIAPGGPGWEASGKNVSSAAYASGLRETAIPVADWVGKNVQLGVRIINSKGRASDWSNLVQVAVAPVVPQPAGLEGADTPHGEQLKWQSPEKSFRVFRQAPGEQNPVQIASTTQPEYLDAAAQFGVTYRYRVQAMRGAAQSEISQPLTRTPKDTFPPAVPAGLTGIASAGSNELVWDRDTEPDLRGYVVYRSVGGGPFARAAEVAAPAYSDRDVQSGKTYRYAVSAVDQSGNESAQTQPVTVTAQ
jgi:hypothetical protein